MAVLICMILFLIWLGITEIFILEAIHKYFEEKRK